MCLCSKKKNYASCHGNFGTFLQERKMRDRFKLYAKEGNGGIRCSSFRCGRHNRHGRHNGGLYTLISIISFDWVVCYIPSVNIIYMSLIFFNWGCWLLTMCMFSATLNIDFLSKSFKTQLIDIGCAFNCFYNCYIYKGEGTRHWKWKHSYTVII